MARRPSADFRERLVAAIDAGLPLSEAAQRFRVSIRTIYRWLARHRRGEDLADRPRSGRPPKLGPGHVPIVRELVLAQPDATLAEHVARLAATTGIHLSPAHLSRVLARLGLPLKKKSLIAVERDEDARAAWRAMMAAVDPADLLFLDETSTPITMTPLRARAPRGQRAVGRVPRGKRPHISWLATLSAAGLGESVVVEGAVDGQVFTLFVERVLVPRLRPGQIVVWDNLNVHKSTRARELIEAAGCRVVFLPSYSPDCNPIEQAFAKTKQALRRIGPRSWESVVAAVGEVLDTVTAADARAFFADAGFPLS